MIMSENCQKLRLHCMFLIQRSPLIRSPLGKVKSGLIRGEYNNTGFLLRNYGLVRDVASGEVGHM